MIAWPTDDSTTPFQSRSGDDACAQKSAWADIIDLDENVMPNLPAVAKFPYCLSSASTQSESGLEEGGCFVSVGSQTDSNDGALSANAVECPSLLLHIQRETDTCQAPPSTGKTVRSSRMM